LLARICIHRFILGIGKILKSPYFSFYSQLFWFMRL
jgi:hypothetical protein